MVFTFVTAILNVEGVSRKYSVYIKFIISYLAVDLVVNFFNSTLITGLFANIGSILIISILLNLYNLVINLKNLQ